MEYVLTDWQDGECMDWQCDKRGTWTCIRCEQVYCDDHRLHFCCTCNPDSEETCFCGEVEISE